LRAQLIDFYQKVGLRLINTIATTGDYQVREYHYGDGLRQRYDHYVTDSAVATVIFIYGGNWRAYNKRNFRFVADTLSEMNVNVMIPDFPLYPEHRFDDILKGVVSAIDHFLENNCRQGPVFLMGHSSGAQKAALLTLDETLLKRNDRITAMIGLAGPYDFYPFTDDDHWDLFGPEEHYPRSQPVNYVRADAPELYLLHGVDDKRVRRGHSKSLMEKQIAAGGEASREVYEGMGHVDAVLSFSRIHRRKSKLIRDIQLFIESKI
jgi:acetyl esterase/lipase